MAQSGSVDWKVTAIDAVRDAFAANPVVATLVTLALILLAALGLIVWRKVKEPRPTHAETAEADHGAAATAVGENSGTIIGVVHVHAPAAEPESRAPTSDTICLSKLPTTGDKLVGREGDLATLDRHLAEGANVVTVVAEGGVGKTALAGEWLEQVKGQGWRRVFAWSFYSQGTDRQTSSGPFIDAALNFFGHAGEVPKAEWDRGCLLAGLVRAGRNLLVLDGLEPLQYGPGPMEGRLKDLAVQALLKELAADNPGLCLVTTRQGVADLAARERGSAPRLDLHTLSQPAGAELLRLLGVTGSESERRALSAKVRGHALTLTLLGSYLRVVHDGDIRKAAGIRLLAADRDNHARHVLDAYVVRLEPKHLAVLGMVGLFDRPAAPELVAELRRQPVIAGLTDALAGLSEAEWKFTLDELHRARLLLDGFDAHPLVREYFGDRLRNDFPAAWREAHGRLYEHLRDSTEEFPASRDGLQPLYQAVAHGCAAGRHQEALKEVLFRRIRRGEEAFNTKKLGDFGGDLSVLAGFVGGDWCEPVAGLTPGVRAWVVNAAAFTLRALGRLDEALAAMRAGLTADEGREDWINAAIAAGNLSQALLLAGRVAAAGSMAGHAVALADRSGDVDQRMMNRTTQADALAQAGRADQAADLFAQAETMQAERQPDFPRLTSLQGFQYCDLLLDRGDAAAVAERAAAARDIAKRNGWLLDVALDTLSLGRAALALGDHGAAVARLDEAVAGLRQAGQEQYFPLGLLARAELHRRNGAWELARRDLDEVDEIAGRGGMKLHLTDLALEEARLALARGQDAKAREHLAAATALVAETGYHRRDGAVAELERVLGVEA